MPQARLPKQATEADSGAGPEATLRLSHHMITTYTAIAITTIIISCTVIANITIIIIIMIAITITITITRAPRRRLAAASGAQPRARGQSGLILNVPEIAERETT